MIVQWIFSILSGSVPEFQTEPWRIGFHLAAEFATAALLILGGITVLRSLTWGRPVLLIGLGMLIYSEIVSPGYFAQLANGRWWGCLSCSWAEPSGVCCSCCEKM